MDKNESIYCQFIIDKLENAGGCLQFQHITGHLSQLDDEVRRAVGTKPPDLMRFLRNHDSLFGFEKNSVVRLKKSRLDSDLDRNDSEFEGNDSKFRRNDSKFDRNDSKFDRNNSKLDRYNSNYDRNDNTSNGENVLPKYLKEHNGIVIKVLPNYGFIASKKPKTTVYFTAACFENHDKKLLTDLVEPGKKVCFNARKGDAKFESKYQATQVWIPDKVENEVLHPEGFQKLKKTRDTGLFDSLTSEGSGKVQNVFKDFGFIVIDNDPKNTVYFTKKNVCNVENILDLTKVMKTGDDVEYKAVRSKKDCKTRWQANKVWIKGHGKSHVSREETVLNNQRENSRELRKNEPGKIYPNVNGAVIKFGPKFEHLADADSCLFYMHGIKVTDVCWEFSDGDNVIFDAIKIKSAPGWKVLISWVGQRPDIVLPEDLGDFSAFQDEDMDDIPETGSVASKTSDTSTLSELSRTSSGIIKTVKSSSSKDQKSSKTAMHRDSRENKKSDFRGTSTRSLSRSSRSSQHSNSNAKNSKKSKSRGNASSDRSSSRTFWNSRNQLPSRFENDSGFGSDQYMPREQKDSYFEKDTRQGYGNNLSEYCRDTAKDVASKPLLKSDSPKKTDAASKTYTNWGDSPYPDEEENESDPDAEGSIFSEVCEETLNHPSANKKSSHSKWDTSEKYEEEKISDKFSDSEVDFESAVNEIENENLRLESEVKSQEAALESGVENILEETSEDDNASVSQEPQVQPYIKRFSELSGNVLKVYCKYAEIENERLKKPGSFFWTDLYCNGRPAPDHFDDLKEVLREGQTIKFNCIEIVDDSGSCWQKITMAWKGQKPKIKEMTPEEYIFENSLVVTVSEELIEETDSYQDQTEQQKPVAPTRKFLTLAVESEDDEDEEEDDDEEEEEEESSNSISKLSKASVVKGEPFVVKEEPSVVKGGPSIVKGEPSIVKGEPSIVKAEPFDCNRQEPLILSGDIQESLAPANLKQLMEVVGAMFLSYKHSETDVHVIASDVVNCILSKAKMKSAPASATVNSFLEKESQTETNSPVACPEDSSVSRKVDVTESHTQTIITGDIIAQSIFTL